MKIIFVRGLGDYDAVSFKDQLLDGKDRAPLALWQTIYDATVNFDEGEAVMPIDKVTNMPFEAVALEFDLVDDRFIDFIREEIQDYDHSKCQNFFIVDE